MPHHDDPNSLARPPAPATEPLAWYQRVPVASAVFACGLAALLVSILIVRPASRSDGTAAPPGSASPTAPAGASAQATGTEPPTEVLGEQQSSDRVSVVATLTVDGVALPLASQAESLILDGTIRADWRLTEAPPDLGTDPGFVSITVDVVSGAIAFTPDAEVVVEIRCVRGACAQWRRWTPLKAGVVDEKSATTLVPRADFAGVEAFALRTARDPGSYFTP